MKIHDQINPEKPQQGLYRIKKEHYSMVEAVSVESLKLASYSLADYLHFKSRIKPKNKGLALKEALHLKLLEPERFSKKVFTQPKVLKNSNSGKIELIRFYLDEVLGFPSNKGLMNLKADQLRDVLMGLEVASSAKGKIILLPEESKSLKKMADSVKNHPMSDSLLRGGEKEISILWEEPESEFMLKCRPDFLNADSFRMVDVIVTKDPSPNGFAREIVNNRYHMSAALFIDALHAQNQSIKPDLYFLAVGSQEPFVAEIYRLSSKSLQEGRILYQKALEKLVRFFRHYDIYLGYTDGSITEIDINNKGEYGKS